MGKGKVWGFIALAFLLAVTIVVFALSLAIFLKLQNAPGDQLQVRPTTPQPPSPTTSSVWYSCRLTDLDTEWKDQWADPTSADYWQRKNDYETLIKNVLVATNSTVYENVLVKLTSLSGVRLDSSSSPAGHSSASALELFIGLPSTLPTTTTPALVEHALSEGSRSAHLAWRDISVRDGRLPPPPEPGTSPGWRAAAAMFLSSINTSVDPCQDFFRYSCDNYLARHPLGEAASQSTFGELQAQVTANLTRAFEALLSSRDQGQGPLPEAVKMAGNMYKACKAASSGGRNASMVLSIADAYGGWPILDPSWTVSRLLSGGGDVFRLVGEMTGEYTVSTLLTPMVSVNFKNVTSGNILYLDQATLAVPAAYYKSPNLTDRYQNLLKYVIYNTATALKPDIGQNQTFQEIIGQVDRMVELEYRLALISVDAGDQRNMSAQFNAYSVQEAEREFPTFGWRSYMKGLLGPGEDLEQLLNPFVIAQPQYVRKLDEFLSQLLKDESTLKDLVNYLIYRLINPFLQFAGPDAFEAANRLRRETRIDIDHSLAEYDDQQEGQAERECVSWLVNVVPYAAGRLYVDNYFPPGDRDHVSVMINNVLSSFSSSLGGLSWMDDESVLKAFDKVAGLIRNVAYPDFQQSDSQLDDHYRPLIDDVRDIIDSDDDPTAAYYEYFTRSISFQARLMVADLKKLGNRMEFLMSPAVVNAWYQPERNSITFPAAILNQPFYRSDFPQAVNYGGLGVVMGHELSHGFDDQGVQFDRDGTLGTWMSPVSESGFDRMAQCVVDQYSGFCYPQGLCLNGVTTQGENIGDNGGLKAAYRAYRAYTASHGPEKPLPGMETFSMDQVFFLAYAQVWCGSYSDDALTRLILTNPHSPGRDRVIGALSNFPKFARAFRCKLGDAMYPKAPCDVW